MDENKEPVTSDFSAAVLKNEDDHYVVLPCDISEFGNFVTGLLGKPQELNGYVEGTFDVNYQEIVNIFHLVNTRVSDQNEGTLTFFSITVHYSNGTSITHNDVKKFKSYVPVDSCFPFEIVLNFTYLIKFPNNGTPEKQVIQVAILTDSDHSQNRKNHYIDGAFEYSISYTNRTWATDIGSLLKNHGETFVEKSSKFKRWLRMYISEVLSTIISIMMVFLIVSWALHSYDVISKITPEDLVTGEYLDGILKYFVSSLSIISIAAILLYYIKKVSEYNLYPPLDSFIVLAEKDSKYRDKRRKKSFWKWIAIFGTWLFSVVASLVANYLNQVGYFL